MTNSHREWHENEEPFQRSEMELVIGTKNGKIHFKDSHTSDRLNELGPKKEQVAFLNEVFKLKEFRLSEFHCCINIKFIKEWYDLGCIVQEENINIE